MLPHNDSRNTGNGRHGYSLLKAVRSMLPGAEGAPLDGIEAEVHAELARRFTPARGGILVPTDLRFGEARDLTTTTGSGAVLTRRDGSLIEALRNKSVVSGLGAVYLDGLEPGKLKLPRMSTGATAGWVGEGSALGSQSPQLDAPTLSPTLVGAYLDLSRAYVSSAAPSAEAFARTDLVAAIASEIDRAVLAGSGSAPEPTGLVNNSAVTTVALGTNGAAPTWAWVCSLEETIGNAKGEQGPLAFVTNPKVRSALRQTEQITGGGRPVWTSKNTVAGMTAVATTSMPSTGVKGTGSGLSSALCGDFGNIVVGSWGALELLVDPFTQAGATAEVRVTAFLNAAVALRHAESFARCLDIVAS